MLNFLLATTATTPAPSCIGLYLFLGGVEKGDGRRTEQATADLS